MIELQLKEEDAMKLAHAVQVSHQEGAEVCIKAWGMDLVFRWIADGKITGYINDTSGG